MKIIMLSDYRRAFRQGIKQYLSMDKDIIIKTLSSAGIEVVEYNYEQLINKPVELCNEIIIYTSSQNQKYKNYIDDILYHLSKQNKLLPRYEIFKAHENKGYQDILKKENGIEGLSNFYFGNYEGVKRNSSLITKYPIVLKKIEGAGSSNVFKINSQQELLSLVRKLNKPTNYFKNSMKFMIKKYILKSKYSEEYYKDDIFMGSFVLQKFVDGLTEDWKVLVFGSSFYVLNRKVRDNDFRASGSGKLSYIDPPKEVLDYAQFVFEKLDVPCVSLDIAYDGSNSYLIEFQGLHFGPYTIMNSDYYFVNENGSWRKIYKKSKFEQVYATSIIDYVGKRRLGE